MEDIIGSSESYSYREGKHWISMSDLMAGLMMVFLLISIAFMRFVQVERDKIREVAIAYQNTQVAIYQALDTEFKEDLEEWDAEISQENLEFRFRSPEVLFDTGEITLKTEFMFILDDFIPRYLNVLDQFRAEITEVRIEGHTDSIWEGTTVEEEAYFNNMQLSQGRTRAVLRYAYVMPSIEAQREWVKDKFSAVGFSSSRLILDERGDEDRERSRRVTFRVVTNAELQIMRIIDDSQ